MVNRLWKFDSSEYGPFKGKRGPTRFKGNAFPLRRKRARIDLVNRRLTDHHIRTTCRDLLAQHGATLTGRQLRRTLRQRYGAVGKTERVFGIWRELTQGSSAVADLRPTDAAELHRRLHAATAAAAQAVERAELSEFRARADQDRWAAQIDDLRQHLQAQPATQAQVRVLQDQVQRLSIELLGARAMIARYEAANELLNASSDNKT